MRTVRSQYQSALSRLQSTQTILTAALTGFEQDTTLPESAKNSLEPSFEKMGILSVEIESAIAVLNLDYQTAVQTRDPKVLQNQVRVVALNQTVASKLYIQYTSLRSDVLTILIRSKVRYKDWPFLKNFVS
jgi:hypothetical protein